MDVDTAGWTDGDVEGFVVDGGERGVGGGLGVFEEGAGGGDWEGVDWGVAGAGVDEGLGAWVEGWSWGGHVGGVADWVRG